MQEVTQRRALARRHLAGRKICPFHLFALYLASGYYGSACASASTGRVPPHRVKAVSTSNNDAGRSDCLTRERSLAPPKVISPFGAVSAPAGANRPIRPYPHTGVDLAADVDTLVSAAADGVVYASYETVDDGGVMVLFHPTYKVFTAYGHLKLRYYEAGSLVARGKPIGTVGVFPFSNGIAHLHWELCTELCRFSKSSHERHELLDPFSADIICFEYTNDPSVPRVGDPPLVVRKIVLVYPIACSQEKQRRQTRP